MNWRTPILAPHQQALCLIRAAAWLVPAASRDDWRREWTAELHYAARLLDDRGARSSDLLAFARGAFHDAAWHRARSWDRDQLGHAVSRASQSPGFCLASLAALVLLIAFSSGFLRETRTVLLPLPYDHAARVATIAQGSPALAVRAGIHDQWVRWWLAGSRLIDDAATYSWSEQLVDQSPTLRASVSENFFPLLGARDASGRRLTRDSLHHCPGCVFLSYDFAHRLYGAKTPSAVVIHNRRVPVAGTLDPRFWFLTRRIGVWQISPPDPSTRTGVVLRLAPDVSPAHAEADLESVLRKNGVNAWSSLISISPLKDRVRSVLGSFALAFLLAIGTVLPAVRPTFTAWTPRFLRRALFFCSKSTLALLAVLLAGLEFTRASSINMLGGTDLATEPFSTWLFLLGSMGALSWSIFDQRRRCPVCLRRFGLAAHIGCPGCVLLSWSGTEMVCLEGHGTLHVPETPSSWQQPDQWTSLDDSVLELFGKPR